jgi:hypothetical protein
MGSDLVFQWRKSSFSGGTGQCVEVAAGAVRDSKNTAGPTLRVDVRSLITFAQSGRFTR